MAYNLESLEQILEQFLHPDHNQQQIETLLQKVYVFKDLFENSSSAVSGYRRRGLESRIRDIAYNAEDFLESHLVDQLLACREGESFIFSPPDLEKLIRDLDSVNEDMMSNMEESEMQLKYRLMGGGSELEVIPIVGMGGIGKTTLARNIYKDRLVSSCFDVRAWATISQDYNVRKILLGLLHLASRRPTYEMRQMEIWELGNYLSKTLFGRRYLIVLGDMWYAKSWDDIGRFLPDNKNGSRIIITSPLGNRETCSPGLESVGRKIAEKCSGLPLAISVIGGLLSQAERTQVFWEQVAEDVSLTIADNNGQILSILSLYYNYLPYHLKPCFLYTSAFPKDYDIHASKLIKLWVAERFLKPISGKSLEEAADMYLMDLIDRNLIVIQQQRPEWYVKSYGIHDLLRDLGMKKAYDENFLFVQRPYLPGEVHSRRVCVHSIEDIDTKLLRVLDVLEIEFHWFPKEILQLINLRYLALSTSELPSSISGLWNLQILIVQAIEFSSEPRAVMPEISDVMHLRHIKFKGFYVWILQTIPNLEKLGIFLYRSSSSDDNNFPRLQHLVIRHCSDLKEIPLRVGDIPTLKVIEVHECSSSVVDSARMIQEEQLELGNDGLEVRFGTTWLQWIMPLSFPKIIA
ncbi:Disease resistance protein RPP13 [Sesamum angolense]|uniref:Disease resistance protein RPP13 n=1 Tax=Sesamum angolense TaxID=2727404 RepID=A0AAE1WZV6_9LAMI|nr:Disease resistance protein RPP13 [Sesamum angolense]